MRKTATVFCLAGLGLIVLHAGAQASKERTEVYRLDSIEKFETVNTKAEIVSYRGRKALHLAPTQNPEKGRGSMIALVGGTDFKDGTIEVEVAGVAITAFNPTARGFVGVVFRAQEHLARAENIYLRPTNGRADDQLRRNHSVQYESIPEFPWDRLRKEAPGVYESYADLEDGAWTKMKIEVAGTKARLYVNGAEQPCLIVNDLKLGDVRGKIGLWAHITSDAYFSNLKVTQKN
jgi:3-keto-disaccharide hydrolase